MKPALYPLLVVIQLLGYSSLLPVTGKDIEVACKPPPGSVGATRLAKVGQDRKKADPTPGPVFPVDPVPAPPEPTPQPKPGSPIQLGANMTYIVASDADAIVTARPKGFVKVTKEKGPIKIRSVFPSSKGGLPETKTFTQAYVFVVEPLTKGDTTLIYAPKGADSDDDWTERLIQVLDGPIPPPQPITVTISPTSATVPVGGKQQFVGQASQGGVKWALQSGVGSVDQNGLFTAPGSSGTAIVVATATLDPSKTASATVTVTDVPPNPLTQALQAAYTAETDAGKADLMGQLGSVCKVAVATAKLDPAVTTLAKLQTKIDNGTNALVGVGKMPLVRKVASEYIAARLPKVDQTMTDALWQTAASAYADVAAAMGNVRRGK